MLSRRNVRVKVMQMLFTLSRDEELKVGNAIINYRNSVKESYDLLLFSMYNIIAITKSAVADEKKRKGKHLPLEYDKLFTAKLYKNPIIQSIVSNTQLQNEFKKLKFDEKIDEDYCQKIYTEFSKEALYKEYVKAKTGNAETLEILLELFRVCRKNELFNEVMEDKFPVWLDDKSLIIGAIKKWLKALPSETEDQYKEFLPDSETVKDFGEMLLGYTHKNDTELLEVIKPTLENWDHERLAIVDMILLKMAIAELINFSSIPAKVTLNEYVEVSKQYSTAKSKDFINGILDKVIRQMIEEGKLDGNAAGLDK